MFVGMCVCVCRYVCMCVCRYAFIGIDAYMCL